MTLSGGNAVPLEAPAMPALSLSAGKKAARLTPICAASRRALHHLGQARTQRVRFRPRRGSGTCPAPCSSLSAPGARESMKEAPRLLRSLRIGQQSRARATRRARRALCTLRQACPRPLFSSLQVRSHALWGSYSLGRCAVASAALRPASVLGPPAASWLPRAALASTWSLAAASGAWAQLSRSWSSTL